MSGRTLARRAAVGAWIPAAWSCVNWAMWPDAPVAVFMAGFCLGGATIQTVMTAILTADR